MLHLNVRPADAELLRGTPYELGEVVASLLPSRRVVLVSLVLVVPE